MFKFQQERLDTLNSLGSGSFGEVFPYQKNPQDLKWVVKSIFAKNVDDLISFLPEIVLGFACDHPCIVPVKGYFIQKEQGPPPGFRLFLKSPRMKESLADNFKSRKIKKNPFTEIEIIQHFYSLACGLQYLHAKKIYHGDIRHDNLLLDGSGKLKIADVGIAKHVEDEDSYQTIMGQKGTYEYSAPEVLEEKAKKETLAKGDVWSLGVVILELCLFENKLLNSQLPQDKLQAKLEELLGRLEGKYQKPLQRLIRRMLSLNGEGRPNFEQIKSELEQSFLEILDQNFLGQVSIDHKSTRTANQQIFQEISKECEIERREANEIDCLRPEKIFFERELRDVQYNLEMRMKKDLDDYENQIKEKSLQEYLPEARLSKEPMEFTAENARESLDENYFSKLDKVVSQLNDKWRRLFKIKTVGKILVVSSKKSQMEEILMTGLSMTVFGLTGLSMTGLKTMGTVVLGTMGLEREPAENPVFMKLFGDLALILTKNNLNLFGLEIHLENDSLRGKWEAMELGILVSIISSQSLEHLILNFKRFEYSPSKIKNFLETITSHINHIKLSEFYFLSEYLKLEERDSIQRRFSHFTKLEINGS